MASKELNLLKKLAPTVERVALMYDPSQPAADGMWAAAETAAPSLALHAAKVPVHTTDDIGRVIVALAREPNGGLFVMTSGATVRHRELIAKLALQYRLPSMSQYRFYVDHGIYRKRYSWTRSVECS